MPRAARDCQSRRPGPLNRQPAKSTTSTDTLPAGARAYRLSGARAFEALFRDGRRFEGRYVQIVAKPAAALPGQAGFVLGRKALRRSVDRNRLRRCLREMLRAERPQSAAVDVVVRLKRPLPRAEMPLALAEAGRLLRAAVEALGAPQARAKVR